MRTARCRVDRLVFYEIYRNITDAIAGEKEMEGWSHQNKNQFFRVKKSKFLANSAINFASQGLLPFPRNDKKLGYFFSIGQP